MLQEHGPVKFSHERKGEVTEKLMLDRKNVHSFEAQRIQGEHGEQKFLLLRSLMHSEEGWGCRQGEQVRTRLESLIASFPQVIWRIDLTGITRTDVPFARSAVVELARHERMKRGFCLTGVQDEDILENWDAAAVGLQQPLLDWSTGFYRLLGPPPSIGLREMFLYVLSVPIARTSAAADALHLKLPNASNKLNHLWQEGYILRREHSATSGGVEYDYLCIA